MNEEIVNLSGVIGYEELGSRVVLTIRKQTKYGFLARKTVNGREYGLGSDARTEYRHRDFCGDSRLFLKGRIDSSIRNMKIEIRTEDWEVYKDMLTDEGFELIDATADRPEPAPVSEVNEDEKISFKYTGETPTDEEIEKMISLVDLNVFTNIIKARLRHDDADGEELRKINRDWAKNYLRQWAIKKYRFYKLLGNKLKIEKDIEVEADDNYFQTAQLELAQKFPLYSPMIQRMSWRAFKRNRVDDDTLWEEAFSDKRVTDGMSLTKFISLFGSDELNIEVSKMYQNQGKAHVTISIDPNDYLTVSINHSGWRSCHNFIDGEWRNAGLSYMVDDTSMVAYKSHGEVNYKFGNVNFRWNSKNWRQMIYVSKENSAIIFSRQYPNESDEVAKAIRKIFEGVVSEYYNVPDSWKVYGNANGADVDVTNEGLLYNDVEHGFGHRVIKNKFDVDMDKSIRIHLGGIPKSVTCPDCDICGECDDL